MPHLPRIPPRLRHPDSVAMAVYFLFTLIAVVGYLTFGLHPELLANWPALSAFYGQAFTLFAQGHVLLGAAVLGFYLVRHVGYAWLPAFAAVYLVSFLSEFIGTGYGIPFGAYHYTDLLGPKWFGEVPLLIPLSWFLMALPAYAVVRRWLPRRHGALLRIALAALLFVTWDLSLDPAMSYLTSYWVWEEGGSYYGMPLINLGGWLLTALVLMALIERLGKKWTEHLSARWMATFYGMTLLMPLGMVAAAGLWLPVALTFVGLAGCAAGLCGRQGGAHASDLPSNSAPSDEAAPFYHRVAQVGAHDLFEHHARSFSFAAWWFSRKERRNVACLYAFCRTTDDLVDRANGRPREEVRRQLEAWRQLALQAYAGEASGIPWLDEIMTVSAEAGVPRKLIDEIIQGVRMDLDHIDMSTMAELEVYTYRVASVVGIWMCHLAGVRDPATLERAAAMGRAMQLTNILRDVGEDLDRDRLYLPAEIRRRYDITKADLYEMRRPSVDLSPSYRHMIEELLARTDEEYERAFPGLAELPSSYARATAVAAEVYRGIHQEIRRNGYDNLRKRAYTGPFQKVYLALRGLLLLWRTRHLPPADEHAVRAGKERSARNGAPAELNAANPSTHS